MRKGIVFTLILVFVAMMLTSVSAAVREEKLDFVALGVKQIGTSATADDYFGTGVVNLRCSYSSWDSAQEYLWIISNWSASPREPASLLIGELDMAQVRKIVFDYVTDASADMTNNRVSFTKDAAGTQVVARAKVDEATEPLRTPKSMEMEILDTSYKGNVYIYVEYTARMFVGNIVLTIDDTPVNPQTSDSSVLITLVSIISLGAIIIKKRVGCPQ